MKTQTGCASLFITLQKGTLTVMHGSSGDVLLEKVNIPEGSWEKLCSHIKNLCSDSPSVEKSSKQETINSESKVRGYFRKINIYPKRDFLGIKETDGVFTIIIKKSSDKFNTDKKIINAGFLEVNKDVYHHPTLNLIIEKTLN